MPPPVPHFWGPQASLELAKGREAGRPHLPKKNDPPTLGGSGSSQFNKWAHSHFKGAFIFSSSFQRAFVRVLKTLC